MRVLSWLSLFLAGCTATYVEPTPEPGPLQAGIAQVRMPIPVGVGTAGFSGFGLSNPTPYSEMYPGTTSVHGHPDFRALVLSRGDGAEVVFLRSDTVGVFQQFRGAIVEEVQRRTGKDLSDSLILGATHTHSGPGRVVQGGGPLDLIADRFFPEMYERMIQSAADAVELAYADLAPARVGTGHGGSDTAHNDRRCEDGLDYQNPDMPFVAVERDGQVDAVLLAYSVHGTILGRETLTLSQDVTGAIEQAVEARFDHPVQAIYFQSWAADMSPGGPEVPRQEGASRPGGHDAMEVIGYEVADKLLAALPDANWQDEPSILSRVERVPLSVEAIGYEPGIFDYPYGGVFCGQGLAEDCDLSTQWNEVPACIPFPEDHGAPQQTEIGAGQIGDLRFVTFPGEPGTLLAEAIMERLRDEVPGTDSLMFLGYSLDYTGYSILEEDWYQGGYEAGGAIWGPRQGEYLSGRAVDVFGRTFAPSDAVAPLEPPPLPLFVTEGYTPVAPTAGMSVGEVVTQVPAEAGVADTVEFAVKGEDPWLGAPVAFVETAAGEVVTWPNGKPMTSDSVAFHVKLDVEPPYSESATARSFTWRFALPVQHVVPGGPVLDGEYRVVVEIPGAEPVRSDLFTVLR